MKSSQGVQTGLFQGQIRQNGLKFLAMALRFLFGLKAKFGLKMALNFFKAFFSKILLNKALNHSFCGKTFWILDILKAFYAHVF